MVPVTIRECTCYLAPPEGWDPSIGGPALPLPIRVSREGYGSAESAWRPSSAELALLNQGGVVILRIAGAIQPPVTLRVAPTDAAEPSA